MTELNEAHFELHSRNKDKQYQKVRQAKEAIKELLKQFNSDDLINMIMQEVDKD